MNGSMGNSNNQTLSQYLSRAIKPIEDIYPRPEKVVAEIVKIDKYKGTLYIELAEYSGEGKQRSLVARASGAVYYKNANIIQAFEKATGTKLARNMKVLVDVIASYSTTKGISVEIVGIDHTYTAGDMLLMQKRIKKELQAKGIYQNNRQIESPFDYHSIGIISPTKSAGLEDFNKKLEDISPSVLQRQYQYCTFQSDKVGHMISAFIKEFCAKQEVDAIVIIRGGGGTSDLNYLNNSELAHAICESTIPIYVGVGHQTDNLLIDEIAHRSFPTPSLVASYIRETILSRANQIHMLWCQIRQDALKRIERAEDNHKDSWNKLMGRMIEKCSFQGNMADNYIAAISHSAKYSVQRIEADVEKTYNAIQYSRTSIKSRYAEKEKFKAKQIEALEKQKRKHSKQLMLVVILCIAIALVTFYLLGNK